MRPSSTASISRCNSPNSSLSPVKISIAFSPIRRARSRSQKFCTMSTCMSVFSGLPASSCTIISCTDSRAVDGMAGLRSSNKAASSVDVIVVPYLVWLYTIVSKISRISLVNMSRSRVFFTCEKNSASRQKPSICWSSDTLFKIFVPFIIRHVFQILLQNS